MNKIHIAGHGVMIGSVARQLCAWCGEKLMDDDWSLIATEGPSGPLWWPEGQLLEVGPGFKSVIAHDMQRSNILPPNCCASPLPAPLRLVPLEERNT